MTDRRDEIDTVPEERRRVLVVSYHFGMASATGGFRWHALAEGLEARGWQVHVLTAAPAQENEKSGPTGDPGPHVITVPATEGVPLFRKLLDRQSHTSDSAPQAPGPSAPVSADSGGAPPAEVGLMRRVRTMIGRTLHRIDSLAADWRWMRDASRVARSAMVEHRYSVVVVSAPPMMSLLVGRGVATAHRVPFVADYRDPWFFGAGTLRMKLDPAGRFLASRLDRLVQGSATVVVHNTGRARQAVESELSSINVRRTVIMNGYDGQLPDVRPDPDCFRVLYGGWIHPYMDPRPLLRGLGRLRRQVQPAPGTFQVEFLGSPREFDGVPLLDLANSAGLEGCVKQTERLPRAEAIARQQHASVLTALDYPHGNAVVMKFFDYAQMYGTMLLLGQPKSALAEAAHRIGVPVIDPADDESIDERLQLAWQKWQNGDWEAVNDETHRFSRRHCVEAMHDLLLDI